MTVDSKALEAKLREMHPEIEKYSIDLDVKFDEETKAWLATFTKGKDSLSTHIDPEDAKRCLEGVECVYFGVQVGRFVKNYCLGSDACEV